MKRLKRLVLTVTLGLLLTFAVGKIISRATPKAVPLTMNSGQHFLPPFENARDRFGFDCSTLSGYDVSLLNAGWYSNWTASANPSHPDQLAYAQLVRFHAGADRHDPDQVRIGPSKATIAQIAAAHPGSLWLLGNEPDSVYQGEPIFPEVYAIVYHDVYEYIKGLDPTALIANGGIVQPTPCRLMYLDIVWDTYWTTYSETMPVDVWNIHAFILREVYNSWGASTPPGVPTSCAMDYTIEQADNMDIFEDNIRAMRAWMQERGYRDKPLIISEYGILWPTWYAPQFTQRRVSYFMTQTFELFLDVTDPEIGYPADDYRLVQTWAWYSLSDDSQYNGYLFHSGSKVLSLMGSNYAAYAAALDDTPQADLSAGLVAAWPSLTPTSGGPLTFPVTLTGSIGNLGKLPATQALARFETVLGEGGTAILGHDAFYTAPARFDGVVTLPPVTTTLAAPGRHELRLNLDPENQIDELREWNNVATATVDLRPDLTPLSLTYRLISSAPQSRTLAATTTVSNLGAWASPPASVTVRMEALPGSTLIASQGLSIPSLAPGEQVDLATAFAFSPGLYALRAVVDPDGSVDEPKENNVITATLDVWPDLAAVTLDYQLAPLHEGTVEAMGVALTSTVRNQGDWYNPPASATVYLEAMGLETPVISRSLALPSLTPDAQVALTTSLTWLPDRDLYRLRIVLDEEGRVSEQNVDNNQRENMVPLTASAELVPTATTVLSSFSGDVGLVFPAGAVNTPTKVVFIPFWPPGRVPASLRPSSLGFTLTGVSSGPLTFARPISVTWRYGDGDVDGLKVERLRLFGQRTGEDWPDAACRPYQREPEQNRIRAFICQTGQFAFGNRHELYLPLAVLDMAMTPEPSRGELFHFPEASQPSLPPRLSPPEKRDIGYSSPRSVAEGD